MSDIIRRARIEFLDGVVIDIDKPAGARWSVDDLCEWLQRFVALENSPKVINK